VARRVRPRLGGVRGGVAGTRVGRIRFAATDPYGGSDGTLVDNPHTRLWPVALEGPLDGPLGSLSWELTVAWMLRERPESVVLAYCRAELPDVVGRGEELLRAGAAGAARAGVPLAEFLSI